MKTILAAMACMAIASCTSTRDLQVEMITAQLVKIDTISREPQFQKQLLTWRSQDNIEYISYASMNSVYSIGAIMTLLRTR